MSFPDPTDMGVGQVKVYTTQNGGHPPEFFAERIMAKLFAVSNTAPEPIRAQALAFQEAIHSVILDGIKRAIASDRAYRK